jgi:predicted DNA-binding ribbon-helix-helix protein
MAQSTVIKRSIVIGGHKTSVSLEDAFWQALKEIAAARNMHLSRLVDDIKQRREGSNLSSALRLFVLAHFRSQAAGGEDARKPAKRVLVVDDDPLLLGMTAEMLQEIGCEVRTARDGNEALAKVASDQKIEILITDINMPGMSGYDLVERVKQIRADVKFILLSGRETATQGLPLIRKPFLESDLKRVMSQTTGLC